MCETNCLWNRGGRLISEVELRVNAFACIFYGRIMYARIWRVNIATLFDMAVKIDPKP